MQEAAWQNLMMVFQAAEQPLFVSTLVSDMRCVFAVSAHDRAADWLGRPVPAGGADSHAGHAPPGGVWHCWCAKLRPLIISQNLVSPPINNAPSTAAKPTGCGCHHLCGLKRHAALTIMIALTNAAATCFAICAASWLENAATCQSGHDQAQLRPAVPLVKQKYALNKYFSTACGC